MDQSSFLRAASKFSVPVGVGFMKVEPSEKKNVMSYQKVNRCSLRGICMDMMCTVTPHMLIIHCAAQYSFVLCYCISLCFSIVYCTVMNSVCMYIDHIMNTYTHTGYARCSDKPVVEDSCYARTIGTLAWNGPQSCSNVNGYEVLYTKANCSTSDANVERILTNETTVFVTSSDVYCIQVRAVVNKNCYSHYSTCAQVASLEKVH